MPSAFVCPAACVRSVRASAPIDLHRCVREARQKGYDLVAGVDEAGAGALAGPLVCAAVLLHPGHATLSHAFLNDSKKLSSKRRGVLYRDLLSDMRVSIATAFISAEEIDKCNILEARKRGLAAAVNALPKCPDFLFVDGNFKLDDANVKRDQQEAIVGGDAMVSVIAAASIIAKETRDAFVSDDMHSRFPEYDFARHKGYATAVHRKLLLEFGPCEEHRISFRPVREAFEAHATVATKDARGG